MNTADFQEELTTDSQVSSCDLICVSRLATLESNFVHTVVAQFDKPFVLSTLLASFPELSGPGRSESLH